MIVSPRALVVGVLASLGLSREGLVNEAGAMISLRAINARIASISRFSARDKREVRLEVNRGYAAINAGGGSLDRKLASLESSIIRATSQTLLSSLPKDTLIEWLPSEAEHPDHEHMTHYHDVMTIGKALSLGWGGARDNKGVIHYGCQCRARIVKRADQREVKQALPK